MSRVSGVLPALSGLAIVAAVVVGCSETVTGTPMADPAQTGRPLSPRTTTRTPSTSTTRGAPNPSAPTVPTVPTRTSGPTGTAPAGADTICRDYTAMDEADQRAVIEAIGKDNDVIALNPELWISITAALCTFAEPSTPVKDVLAGQGIR